MWIKNFDPLGLKNNEIKLPLNELALHDLSERLFNGYQSLVSTNFIDKSPSNTNLKLKKLKQSNQNESSGNLWNNSNTV